MDFLNSQSPANIHDKHFQVLVKAVEDQMVVFADQGFHDADGDVTYLKCCRRGQHNERMLNKVSGFT